MKTLGGQQAGTSMTFFPGCSEAISFSPSSFRLVMVASLDSRHLLMKFCWHKTDVLIVFFISLCTAYTQPILNMVHVHPLVTSYCLWRAGQSKLVSLQSQLTLSSACWSIQYSSLVHRCMQSRRLSRWRWRAAELAQKGKGILKFRKVYLSEYLPT